jgi:hypothetical protein
MIAQYSLAFGPVVQYFQSHGAFVAVFGKSMFVHMYTNLERLSGIFSDKLMMNLVILILQFVNRMETRKNNCSW